MSADETAAKRGKRYTENYNVWLTEEERMMLNEIRQVDGLSAAACLRMLIRRAHREMKK